MIYSSKDGLISNEKLLKKGVRTMNLEMVMQELEALGKDRTKKIYWARADLVLVEGDPTTNLSDTLSIREVWQRGIQKMAKA